MSKIPTRFTIRGVRGSVPAAGSAHARFGGCTTCFTLETPDEILAIDAGTGLAALDRDLAGQPAARPITLAFTHFHLDHLIGLPSFGALYRRDQRVRLVGDPRRPRSWRRTLATLMAPPYWPVPLDEVNADVHYLDLPVDAGALTVGGARVTWCPVWHPQECLAYRIETAAGALVIATDREPGRPDFDAPFLAFCRGARWLVVDAQYTPEEADTRRGWGHGHWREAAELACAAGVGALILTHHDPRRTDADIEAMCALARAEFPDTQAAFDGMSWTL